MNNTLTQNAKKSPIDWDRLDALFNSIGDKISTIGDEIASVSEQMKETDRRMEESRKEMDHRMEESRKELNRQIKETDRRLSKLAEQYTSQTGHIMEGLLEPSIFRSLQQAGFNVTQACTNMKGGKHTADSSMEIDVFYMDTVEAIVVETKIFCKKSTLNRLLKKMQRFKEVFPKYADMDIYVAVAALKFKEEAIQYAAEKGILLIHVENDLFTLKPFEKKKLKIF